ncbi:hypothetical protein M9H77_25492 [Catharanthus roseus]|uniref:Uncharacterized protein n=1 Tax=Catharanthus roseus TaxID=4058 RepID=A0ACC0A939_CATRO|nr:hypothetical protein M9H77_25492 [Catharanthus roseus]
MVCNCCCLMTFYFRLFSYDMEREERPGKQKGCLTRGKVCIFRLAQPPKKQRLPLSVARVVMKKQKDREEKMKEESIILGRFGGNQRRDSGKAVERSNRHEMNVLKSSEGHFRNGVLNVKHLLQPSSASKVGDDNKHAVNKGKKKKKNGKKSRGKKKGGGRRH